MIGAPEEQMRCLRGKLQLVGDLALTARVALHRGAALTGLDPVSCAYPALDALG
jgi:hypothetical protein